MYIAAVIIRNVYYTLFMEHVCLPKRWLTWLWQVPEEEKDLGSQDRLIHVYHFTRDASQNHMVVKISYHADLTSLC